MFMEYKIMRGIKPVTLAESQHLVELLDSGLITNRTMAIDGGAHAGAWTVIMAEWFNSVHAFEPHPRAFEYLTENCEGLDNVTLHNNALMDRACLVEVYAPGRTTLTATQVRYASNGGTKAVAIDSFKFQECGLLKLDIEGAEFMAIQGAVETIKRCRPFILVETNNLGRRFGYENRDTLQLIRSLGYTQCWAKGVDIGMKPND